ncbi:MAG: hypothetical protein WCC66_02845 [Rhizobiaceae bacterium]
MAAKTNPLDEIADAIKALSGRDGELVNIRRAFLRVTSRLDLSGQVFKDVEAFQTQAALVSLELTMAGGADIYDERQRLFVLFNSLRADIADALAKPLD